MIQLLQYMVLQSLLRLSMLQTQPRRPTTATAVFCALVILQIRNKAVLQYPLFIIIIIIFLFPFSCCSLSTLQLQISTSHLAKIPKRLPSLVAIPLRILRPTPLLLHHLLPASCAQRTKPIATTTSRPKPLAQPQPSLCEYPG